MYRKSLDNPEEFWGEIAKQFYWETPANHDRFFDYNFDVTKGPIFTKWLDGATTNVSFNLLDRNVRNGNGDKIAFYWLVRQSLGNWVRMKWCIDPVTLCFPNANFPIDLQKKTVTQYS